MFVLPASAHEQVNGQLTETKTVAGSSIASEEKVETWNDGTPEHRNNETPEYYNPGHKITKIRNA